MSRRDEILARRAQFVSAALMLALGCKGDKPNAMAVPDAESKKVTPGPEPKPPPKVAPPLNRPAVTAKVSVSGEAKRAAAAAKIEAVEKSIDELAGAIPAGCDLTDAICRARFKAFADQLAKIREGTYALSPPSCPPKLADDIAIQKMISEQHVWLSRWLDQVEKVGREQIRGDAGSAWQDLYTEATKAYAHPCLEFACP
jgi:hypothetical protein